MAVSSLLVFLLAAQPVIAAPVGPDQSGADGVSWVPAAILLLLAVVAVGLVGRFRWHRLETELVRPKVLPPLLSLVLAMLILVAGVLGVVAARRMFPDLPVSDAEIAPSDELAVAAKIGLGTYAGQAVVVAIFAVLAVTASRGVASGVGESSERPRSCGRWRRLLGGGLLGVAALAVTWPIVNAVGWAAACIAFLGTHEPTDPIAHETLHLLLASPRDAWFAVMVVLVTLVTPVVEEVMYRGLIQDAARRVGLGPWPAILATSFVFASMHWQNTAPHAVAGLFVLSLGFGWAFERTGRLVAPIIMHVLFNAGNLAIAVTQAT